MLKLICDVRNQANGYIWEERRDKGSFCGSGNIPFLPLRDDYVGVFTLS